jgi:hypothetical protein
MPSELESWGELMSESCFVNVTNSSGRSLDSVLVWHTSNEPTPLDLTVDKAVVKHKNLAVGYTTGARAPLAWGTPMDYWTMTVLFQGDGTVYQMAGTMAQGFKEYEVSDGSTLSFTLNKYTGGTTDQSDISIQYSGDEGGTARLLNPTTVSIFGAIGGAMTEAAKHLAMEAIV